MTRGIIIACPAKYETICLENIARLRNILFCQLPVEIWEIGQEISSFTREKMGKFENISFQNVEKYCANPQHWKGFQVKVFALCKNRTFDEILLCDADVTFYKNPEILFSDEGYVKTGAFFFKDLDVWQFRNLHSPSESKFTSLDFFNMRKQWIRKWLPKKPHNFPKEWDYMYDEKIPVKPVKEAALQESGVVLHLLTFQTPILYSYIKIIYNSS